MTDSGLAERLAAVRVRIARACEAAGRDPAEVSLLAVSKRQPLESVREAHRLGQCDFGENRIQDLGERAESLRDLGLRWHQCGPVQSNKVRALCEVPGLHLLHTVDRAKLCDKLEQVHSDLGRSAPLDVLLQVHATGEASKHGVLPENAGALLARVLSMPEVLRPIGLMAMGPLDADPEPVFRTVAKLRERLRDESGAELATLSMGMTGDLEAAVACGSTMVRVGTGVFGARPD